MSDLAKLRNNCLELTKEALKKSLGEDQLIIQANSMIHDLHKINNNLSKRIREWSGWWVPRMNKEIKDHEIFIRELLSREKEDDIGSQFKDDDLEKLKYSARSVLSLYDMKKSLMSYVEKKLSSLMPNTSLLCGASIAADLLTLAGSFKRLATMPSSTIQLLGAETALFRHLKNKKFRSPKHGIIFNHPLIQRVDKKSRGRAARMLDDKIAIAVKVDYFKGDPCGSELRNDLERRFK